MLGRSHVIHLCMTREFISGPSYVDGTALLPYLIYHDVAISKIPSFQDYFD
jgi:hypothetical protein